MTTAQSHPWSDNNNFASEIACEYCQSAELHEFWCITQNLEVLRAWQAVLDPAKLSLHDQLILHALGVAWFDKNQAAQRSRLAVV